jgi:hypothetical protein
MEAILNIINLNDQIEINKYNRIEINKFKIEQLELINQLSIIDIIPFIITEDIKMRTKFIFALCFHNKLDILQEIYNDESRFQYQINTSNLFDILNDDKLKILQFLIEHNILRDINPIEYFYTFYCNNHIELLRYIINTYKLDVNDIISTGLNIYPNIIILLSLFTKSDNNNINHKKTLLIDLLFENQLSDSNIIKFMSHELYKNNIFKNRTVYCHMLIKYFDKIKIIDDIEDILIGILKYESIDFIKELFNIGITFNILRNKTIETNGLIVNEEFNEKNKILTNYQLNIHFI